MSGRPSSVDNAARVSVLGASVVCVVVGVLAGCPPPTPEPAKFQFDLPPSLPEPRVPDDNPMSAAKVALGRRLFYEKRLSINGTTSCGTCHIQVKAFTDGRVTARGATGDLTTHNAMSLANVAYNTALTWANPAQGSLEKQMDIPMFSEHPLELGLSGIDGDVVAALAADTVYKDLFPKAFPDDDAPVTMANVKRAIASFERTLLSGRSPYDAFFYEQDDSALSDSAKKGLELFFSEKCECYHCHGDFNLADTSTQVKDPFPVAATYHNTGLYNVDGNGAYPRGDRGLIDFTDVAGDMGRFRATSLRNIALTAPYMHDGSMATLEEVLIDQYAHGGRVIATGDDAGDGSLNPLKDPLIKGFTLADDEKQALLDFLGSLTDPTFTTDPRFSPAFACPTDPPPACPATPPTFDVDIAPINTKACLYCHTAGGSAGDMPLETRAQLHALHDKMVPQIQGCLMPADGVLTDEERRVFLEWLACGEPE